MEHLSRQRLEAGLSQIRDSPRDGGRIVLVVSRPAVGVRELPGEALLDPAAGLAGDNWLARGSKSMPDGSADPQRQVTVMNARVAELVAGGTDRMALAGDQLYIDLDLSVDNLSLRRSEDRLASPPSVEKGYRSDRKSTRLNSSHLPTSRMPSSA